jgi:hypothetical protein
MFVRRHRRDKRGKRGAALPAKDPSRRNAEGQSMLYKRVDHLTPEDFAAHPVWEYALDMEEFEDFDETVMRPVCALPVDDLGNCVIGTEVRLANGTALEATLSSVDLESAEQTRQFLFLSVFFKGAWVHLERCSGFDRARSGPAPFSAALGLTIEEVFPIAWDVSRHCTGACLRGMIESEPEERLSGGEENPR